MHNRNRRTSFVEQDFNNNMKILKLKDIMERLGLDIHELSRELFPFNQYPYIALKRVIDGKADLNSAQVSRLAAYAGLTIDQLYSQRDWKGRSNHKTHTLETGEYRAEIDFERRIIRLFHKKSLFYDKVLYDKTITVSDLINSLNKIVDRHEAKSKS